MTVRPHKQEAVMVGTARLRRPRRVQRRNVRRGLVFGHESFRPLLRGRGHRKRGVPTALKTDVRPSRRSPGCKAYFSSVRPAPASWAVPAGFTLIEVLLALMISAIVLVAVSLAFAGALQLREHASANLDRSAPVERAMDTMRRDLKNVVPPGLALAGPLQSGAYQGGMDANDGIQIYTTTGLMTPNDPWGDIQKVTYGLQSSSDSTNGGKDLIRAVTRNLLATGPEDEDDQFVLSGVESVTFSYYDGAEWLDTWDDSTQTNLPMAVRVDLQLAATDSNSPKPKPMELLVPLMAQVDTNLLNTWEAMTNSAGGTGGAGGGSGMGGGGGGGGGRRGGGGGDLGSGMGGIP